MVIHGLQKTTLLDFPGRVAATIFFGGCNFRCPFCHNMNLVLHADEETPIPESELFSFLASRKGLLDGVCITGGEPTLQKDLPVLIRKIKDLGLLVKLDTNGTNPTMLKQLLEAGLPDYVAMDVKSDRNGYARICGLSSLDLAPITDSIRLLLEGHVDYEFRTTVIAQFHNEETMRGIGELIQGAKRYFLQSYVPSDAVADCSLTAYERDDLEKLSAAVAPYVDHVAIRGVD